jgi:hypothetical protein
MSIDRHNELWNSDPIQEITSAKTCVRTIPRLFKIVDFEVSGLNLDIGGGPFDDTTQFLNRSHGVINLVFDPFNRPLEHNQRVLEVLRRSDVPTVTVSNVLNVIRADSDRERVIAQAADAVRDDGAVYFQIYVGNGSGVPARSSRGWQENRALSTYVQEIEDHFRTVELLRNVIVAREPLKGKWVSALDLGLTS